MQTLQAVSRVLVVLAVLLAGPHALQNHVIAAGAELDADGVSATPMPDPPPLSPAASLAQLHVRAGYRAELVASEPLVQDPVAIDWGLDGSLWVAEMADYPSGMDGQGQPGGRVRVIRDTDGDGQYDKSTIFLDGLAFPNGVMTWQGGVLITAAPEILYAADTDGDDQADMRETLYSGFMTGNQQLRVNGLRWGLDNWVHCASGSHHGEYGAGRSVTSTRLSSTLVLGSRDFRIRPDSGLIEPESGPSQFGRNQNDWGDWFGVQNSYPLWHYVLADRYIRRNPYHAPADPRNQLILPANPKVFPAKPPEKRFHGPEMAGHFTSACSGIVYRDTLLFDTPNLLHAFTCEPFHNLIQHQVLKRAGASYIAHRDDADGELDFFASRDHWCRPVMIRTGPDGALWVVDMYRYMIEHPEWLPPEGKEALRPYYRSGETMGRIYRVLPEGENAKPWACPSPTEAELVILLQSTNGWLRDKAQQLLVHRTPLSSANVDALRSIVMAPTSSDVSAMHALCALDGAGHLDDATLRAALDHRHWAVRRQAIRIAESHCEAMPWTIDVLVSAHDEPDAAVRLQLACSLGAIDGPASSMALARLAAQSTDVYMRDAVMSSLRLHQLESFVRQLNTSAKSLDGWTEPLGRMVAASGDKGSLGVLLRALLTPASDGVMQRWQWSGLAELADAWERTGTSFDAWSHHRGESGVDWAKMVGDARDVVRDPSSAVEQQKLAVRLLDRAAAHSQSDRELLAQRLTPRTPVELQQTIIHHLARRADDDVPTLLLAGWKQHSPSIRAEVIDALLRRPTWTASLLEAVANGTIAPSDISLTHRQSLLASRDKTVRERAGQLFLRATADGRDELLRHYRQAAIDGGDASQGKRLFEKHCAACHRLEGMGNEVGPNLRALSDRSSDFFLSSILDPNRAVEPRYLSYTVAVNDGSVFSGLIAIETATSMTLQSADGRSHVILRDSIEEVQGTGKSLMPEGMEQEISPREMADLLAYLQQATVP